MILRLVLNMQSNKRQLTCFFFFRTQSKPWVEEETGRDIETNWKSMKLTYDEYDMDENRVEVLKVLCEQFLEALEEDVKKYDNDPLSTDRAVHVTGTQEQSNCPLWYEKRGFLITSSYFLEFCNGKITKNMAKKLWDIFMDLSHLPAIQWGIEHEQDAISDFEDQPEHGKTTSCGLFINRFYPMFGASPDAIYKDPVTKECVVIEVKCPWVLRNTDPNDLDSLEPEQRRAHFREKTCNPPCITKCTHYKLKREHKYYAQCQLQMFVTGMKKTIFIT